MKITINNRFWTGAALLLGACATKAPPDGYSALPNSADASAEISNNRAALAEARRQDWDALAPYAYSHARAAHEEAVERRADDDDRKDILDSIAKSKAWLSIAEKKAPLAEAPMREVLEARRAALDARARKYHREDYADLNEEVREIGEKIERDGELDPAQEKSRELVREFRDLETRALATRYIGKGRQWIRQAKDEDAEDLVPKTLASVQKKMREFSKVAAANSDNPAVLSAAAKEANDEARHLLRVTRHAKQIEGGDAEAMAVRHQRNVDQLGALEESNSANAAALARSSSTAANLANNLATEEQRQARLAAVRSRFEGDEAEVYQQGEQIIIRLKGLNFASSRSDIPSTAFPLMKKVQDVLAEFPEARKVTVQGHTDSVGSAQANKALSQKRASAVEQYLQNAANVPADKMEAVGMGLERPISSNTTAQGRAQNRRIDLVIDTAPSTDL